TLMLLECLVLFFGSTLLDVCGTLLDLWCKTKDVGGLVPEEHRFDSRRAGDCWIGWDIELTHINNFDVEELSCVVEHERKRDALVTVTVWRDSGFAGGPLLAREAGISRVERLQDHGRASAGRNLATSIMPSTIVGR